MKKISIGKAIAMFVSGFLVCVGVGYLFDELVFQEEARGFQQILVVSLIITLMGAVVQYYITTKKKE